MQYYCPITCYPYEKLSQLIEKYKWLTEQLEAEKKQIIRQAKEEALEIIRQSNREIENTIRQIREVQADKEQTRKLRQQLEKGKEKLEKSLKSQSGIKKKPKKKKSVEIASENDEILSAEPLKPGDFVVVKESGVVGKLLEMEGNVNYRYSSHFQEIVHRPCQ